MVCQRYNILIPEEGSILDGPWLSFSNPEGDSSSLRPTASAAPATGATFSRLFAEAVAVWS